MRGSWDWGGGNFGEVACSALADRSVQIFINTIGNPLHSNVDGVRTATVLASYGLFVNKDGLLMSLAHDRAPTKKANELLTPTGYVNKWLFFNGARPALNQLYKSAYPHEALYGFISQNLPHYWQVVRDVPGCGGGSSRTGDRGFPDL